MEVSGQFHAPASFPPGGKSPRYPLDRRLGGPQSRSGRGDEEKEFYHCHCRGSDPSPEPDESNQRLTPFDIFLPSTSASSDSLTKIW
jgi:hypothetical protein